MRNKQLAKQFLINHPKCCNCGKNGSEVHHIVPIVLGGNDIDSNMCTLCLDCHSLLHGNTNKNGQLTRSELTKIGLQKAKERGSQIGQKKGAILKTKKSEECKKIILNESVDFNGSLSNQELIEKLHIARNTFYKYKKELKETKL